MTRLLLPLLLAALTLSCASKPSPSAPPSGGDSTYTADSAPVRVYPSIYFEFDSFTLKPQQAENLRRIAAEGDALVVTCYASAERGGRPSAEEAARNFWLAGERCKAVAEALAGVEVVQVVAGEATLYGAYNLNRRVRIQAR